MAQDKEQSRGSAAERPRAGSVTRDPVARDPVDRDPVDHEPTGEPNPEEHGVPVDQEDGPKGQPTSDRFQTEQAHKTSETHSKGR